MTFAVVYSHPSDFPDNWVVRVQSINAGATTYGPAFLFETLEECRDQCRRMTYFTRHPRMRYDDPAIVEWWI